MVQLIKRDAVQSSKSTNCTVIPVFLQEAGEDSLLFSGIKGLNIFLLLLLFLKE